MFSAKGCTNEPTCKLNTTKVESEKNKSAGFDSNIASSLCWWWLD
jgi:hypothetical protein